MFDRRGYGSGIHAFDSSYVRPLLAAIHLVEEGGRIALIDTGSNVSLENTLSYIQELGFNAGHVDFVILTHIHLDHAGGAGSFMQAFPSAKLVVHHRGARHMVEPSKLVAGVSAVYGAEYVAKVYGKIQPIAVDRIIEARDGMQISLAGRRLLFLDTPGHARHHICIVDEQTGGIFTGDMFGLSYRELDVDSRPFIFPTTTPTQFDPVEMHASIDRLLSFNPKAVYLTHYGQLENVPELGVSLKKHLNYLVTLALSLKDAGETRHEKIKSGLRDYLVNSTSEHGCTLSSEAILEIWATDIELNAQGLGVWLDAQAD